MRVFRLLGASLALWACTSDQISTEPGSSPSLAQGAAATYTAVDLGTLGGGFSSARAINPAGQVAGVSWTAADETHGFLWSKGTMIDLGTLGGRTSNARAINPAGQVVGESETEDREFSHATLRTRR